MFLKTRMDFSKWEQATCSPLKLKFTAYMDLKTDYGPLRAAALHAPKVTPIGS
jgi:hypothetical protein